MGKDKKSTLRETGTVSIKNVDATNIPVASYFHSPDPAGGPWVWTAINFMPYSGACAGRYQLEAESKEEILELIKEYVIPLYEKALFNMEENGCNFYWR